MILVLLTKSRIREFPILMIGSAHNNDSLIREFLAKCAKIETSRILPDVQYLLGGEVIMSRPILLSSTVNIYSCLFFARQSSTMRSK